MPWELRRVVALEAVPKGSHPYAKRILYLDAQTYVPVSSLSYNLADEDFCYLTTTGRVTGQPRTIEIWFALHKHMLYMLAGSREKAGWVKNLARTSYVSVRMGNQHFTRSARIVEQAECLLPDEYGQ